jgi:hypothetical protein
MDRRASYLFRGTGPNKRPDVPQHFYTRLYTRN